MAKKEITETEDTLIIDAPNLRFGFQPNQILHINDFVVDECPHKRMSIIAPGPQHSLDLGDV